MNITLRNICIALVVVTNLTLVGCVFQRISEPEEALPQEFVAAAGAVGVGPFGLRLLAAGFVVGIPIVIGLRLLKPITALLETVKPAAPRSAPRRALTAAAARPTTSCPKCQAHLPEPIDGWGDGTRVWCLFGCGEEFIYSASAS